MVTLEHSPVHSSKEVLGGTLVFRGTRVPAQTLLDYINDGFTIEEFIEFFPSVDKQDALDFLQLIRSDDNRSLIELPTNRWPAVQEKLAAIQTAIENARPGSYQIID